MEKLNHKILGNFLNQISISKHIPAKFLFPNISQPNFNFQIFFNRKSKPYNFRKFSYSNIHFQTFFSQTSFTKHFLMENLNHKILGNFLNQISISKHIPTKFLFPNIFQPTIQFPNIFQWKI